MVRTFSFVATTAIIAASSFSPAIAQNIRSNLNPTVKVGQTVTIKGVRGRECGEQPGTVALPRSDLGTFSRGKLGTVNSRSCGGVTPAREVLFTAKKPGTQSLVIYEDPVTITVVP